MDTSLLEVEVNKVCELGVIHHKPLDSAEVAEGEVLDADINLVFGFLDNQGENLAFDIDVIDCSVRFVKVVVASDEAVGSFGRGLEVLSAFGLPSIAQAGRFVLVIVQQVVAGQTPKVKHGVGFATEAEHVRLKFFVLADNRLVDNTLTAFGLEVQPLVEVGGVKLIDVQLSKGDRFLEVEHCVVSSHGLTNGQRKFQTACGGSPIGQHDFATVQFVDIQGTLVGVVGGIENFRDGKNFGDEEVFARVDISLFVHDFPAQVIDKGLGDCHLLFQIFRQITSAGQSGGFAIKYHIVLSALVELGACIYFHNYYLSVIHLLGVAIALPN